MHFGGESWSSQTSIIVDFDYESILMAGKLSLPNVDVPRITDYVCLVTRKRAESEASMVYFLAPE